MKIINIKTISISIVLIIVLIKISIVYGTMETLSIKVSGKERVTLGSGENISSKYLIFSDSETFQNTDSFFVMKFNSADIYGSIKPGENYNIKVNGFRIPFLSWYRNIIEIKQTNTNNQ